MKPIAFRLTLFVPDFQSFAVVLDEAWLAEQAQRFEVTVASFEDQLMIRNGAGGVIESQHLARHRMLSGHDSVRLARGVIRVS